MLTILCTKPLFPKPQYHHSPRLQLPLCILQAVILRKAPISRSSQMNLLRSESIMLLLIKLKYLQPTEVLLAISSARSTSNSAALDHRLLPQPHPPFISIPSVSPEMETVDEGSDHCLTHFDTPINSFSLFRRYFSINSLDANHDPEASLTLNDLADESRPVEAESSILGVYPNLSAFRLGDWFWTGGQKSLPDFRKLLAILCDPSFSLRDVQIADWRKINASLVSDGAGEAWPDDNTGWITTSVTISVPFHKRRGDSSIHPQPLVASTYSQSRPYSVPGFRYRKLLSIVVEKVTNPKDYPYFQWDPYELWHQSATKDIRVYTELYTSNSFIQAYKDLQLSPPVPGCSLPRVIAALLLYSDATHLNAFGDQQLYPLYLSFGNESKYRRSQPSLHLISHAAYFCKVRVLFITITVDTDDLRLQLPANFVDFARSQTSNQLNPSQAFLTHCTRELAQAQWDILLDNEFLAACKNGKMVTRSIFFGSKKFLGFVVECADKIQRRVYPRIFTYSADYPEKQVVLNVFCLLLIHLLPEFFWLEFEIWATGLVLAVLLPCETLVTWEWSETQQAGSKTVENMMKKSRQRYRQRGILSITNNIK